jgi:hypothetical protein
VTRNRRLTALLVGVALCGSVAALAIHAQTPAPQPSANSPPAAPDESGAPAAPPGVPIIQAPPEEATPLPDNSAEDQSDERKAPSNQVQAKTAPPPAPPAPVLPVRSPAAILQVLDKVTAETMRFAAPVSRPVRYKNIVFTVKACETTGLGGPSPQASAYVVVDSAPLPVEGMAPPPARQVYHGWMFADSPGLHPMQHPIYDAWLVACMTAAPPA